MQAPSLCRGDVIALILTAFRPGKISSTKAVQLIRRMFARLTKGVVFLDLVILFAAGATRPVSPVALL